jgi:nucleotide-binding universal stress UspA family protein
MFTSIVVGTDGSATAAEAVRQAAALARSWSAPLHVVSAYKVSTADAALGMAPEVSLVLTDWLLDARDTVQEMLQDTSRQLEAEGVKVETHCRAGHPVKAICDVAQEQRADLVIVGNRGMQGARRALGSVPNSVSHQAPCSVLIIDTM